MFVCSPNYSIKNILEGGEKRNRQNSESFSFGRNTPSCNSISVRCWESTDNGHEYYGVLVFHLSDDVQKEFRRSDINQDEDNQKSISSSIY
jgi:hypothetical protein